MMAFLHKEGSRGRPHGSRFVWVIVCVRPTLGYLHRIHLSHLTEIQTSKVLKSFFQYQIGKMRKQVENKKVGPDIYLQ